MSRIAVARCANSTSVDALSWSDTWPACVVTHSTPQASVQHTCTSANAAADDVAAVHWLLTVRVMMAMSLLVKTVMMLLTAK
jgi:hypothetical protein